jgi:DNA-binding PucR family transcriptional regulator
MDTSLAAAIVLAFTTIYFAVCSLKQKHTIAEQQRTIEAGAKYITQARKQGYDEGFVSGLKRGLGDMYLAVTKADRAGRNPVEAAAAVGRMHELGS